MYYNRDAIIERCGGDRKKAAIIIAHLQEQHWKQVSRLNKPWPEEEPTPQEEIIAKLDAIQESITQIHKPKEVVIYRDKPIETAKGFTP